MFRMVNLSLLNARPTVPLLVMTHFLGGGAKNKPYMPISIFFALYGRLSQKKLFFPTWTVSFIPANSK